MTTYSSQPDGQIAEDEIPYLQRRAKGGFGLVMTAACAVHPRGKAFDGQWACWSDEFLPSLKKVADGIRDGGAKSCLQIHHGGRACPSRLCGGVPLSASAIPAERPNAETPKEMTDDEIDEAIAAFAAAARRGIEAGFDAIEIHGANTYLHQQFVSPHSNRRDDKWGQNRLLFVERVVDAILQAVPGAVVGYRFSSEEIEEPGIQWEHTAALLDLLCEKGLDFLHVSLWDYKLQGLKGDWPDTTLERVVKKIAGRKPLIGVGKVWTKDDAQAVLTTGADLIALGRSALTNPEWPQQVADDVPIRRKIPKVGAADQLTWPKGLEDKAYNVANWFEIED
jgi:2,4-dienoyl-CoA reductase-like NADH-dependent reductase (Old Yellow Enzyme family)